METNRVLPGRWIVDAIPAKDCPMKVRHSFHEAFERFPGKKFKMHLYCGHKEVYNGMDYMFICEGYHPKEVVKIVTHEDCQKEGRPGKCYVMSIETIIRGYNQEHNCGCRPGHHEHGCVHHPMYHEHIQGRIPMPQQKCGCIGGRHEHGCIHYNPVHHEQKCGCIGGRHEHGCIHHNPVHHEHNCGCRPGHHEHGCIHHNPGHIPMPLEQNCGCKPGHHEHNCIYNPIHGRVPAPYFNHKGRWEVHCTERIPCSIAAGIRHVFGEPKVCGVAYEPLVYCGKRRNYGGYDHMVICKQTLLTHPPVKHVVSVVIHEKAGRLGKAGECSFVSSRRII